MFKSLYESLDAVSKESIQLFREYLIKNEQLDDFEQFMLSKKDTRNVNLYLYMKNIWRMFDNE
ncbi:hypothetical protein BUN12_2140 [Bacillus amyloliquefaciens]|jgi:hypothetical protein|uniref:Uncharacterized protein n=1 Tax=Bacillus amyloliquefaciens (strain ATCC 23350 / DSM 7 / BCRC 11601 / CCUG 28519 / NBRC 15535 / NRRL B-14393 / F) TaxID=692420 RepID=A0A9P1JJK6_BACAS|nr:hypothetical protein BAMTA208_15435 [Bacillus amyloliquefaciens TA208]AEK90272.1 hypothetical protein BAXH7_03152 [Bacillus amyloliquefaciens XH7]AIW34915.1 hypothetical protein KS08_15225 [Bacillus subtilis]AZV90394.1 hypothetical protein BUN12_2140 [Bacillus amyloliquefaciens]CBI44037.1 hypothetical protein predicted by Glimmer/Critica [Bacillus amyloliquefaciens DSM 7] [Bacillus amyloliquefaciens DSM 7 = ATCC 23350]